MHEGDGFHQKLLEKAFHCLKDWSGHNPAGQFECKLCASPAMARFRRRTFHEPNIILTKAI